MGAMAAVASMHEEMHAATQEQEQERPGAQKMRAVFEHQKERRDPEEDAERQPRGRTPEDIPVIALDGHETISLSCGSIIC
jgi:hypothetical protein